MASLLDFLNAGGGGLLGNFGGRFSEPEPMDELQRIRQQMYGAAGRSPAPGGTALAGPGPGSGPMAPFQQGTAYLGSDPFNFLMPQGQQPGGPPEGGQQVPSAPPPGWLSANGLSPVVGSAPASAPSAPMGGMPVSLEAPPASPATTGYMAPIAPQAAGPSFGSRVNDFLGNNSATLMALGGGIARHGIGGGFLDAAPFAAVDRKEAKSNQAQAALAQALVASNVPPATALAIAQNPQAAKDFMPVLKETRKDPFTGKTEYGGFNPFTAQPIPGAKGASGGTSGTSYSDLQPQYNAEGKDEAFLAALRKEDPISAEDVLRVAKGEMPATGRNLQQIMRLAGRYDQNFTGAQDYQTRLQTAKSFAAGGKDADVVRRANQALVHADAAWNLIPKIAMTNIGGPVGSAVNAAGGAYYSATDPQYQSDRSRYTKLINALAGELRAAANGSGHGSLEEIRNWQTGSLAANSAPEMRGSIRGAMDFLEGITESMSRKKSEGLKSQFSAMSLLDPKNAETFQRIRSSDESGAAPAAPVSVKEGSTATNPQTGQKIIFKAGKWAPMQ